MTQTCLVNLFHLDPARNGGASRLAKAVCRMLADLAQTGQLRVIFAVGWRFAPFFPAWLDYPQAEVIPCLPELGLTPLFKQLQPAVVVSPLAGLPPFDDAAHSGHTPHVVRVSEILWLDHPELLTPAETRFHQRAYAALPYAAKVTADSEYVRQRLINHLGLASSQVVTIHLAGDYPILSDPASLAMNPSPPYLFYPANSWPHKRHDLLLQIMERVWQTRPEFKLVLAGWLEPGLLTRLRQQYACPPEKIIDLGYISSDSQLAALYQGAEALLFTSQWEGFGMPLLEAMANRCPVICAPLAAIPEVAGEAALYVNSDDPKAWAEALLTTLPEQRPRLIEQGQEHAKLFSWERVRRQWLQVLNEVGLHLSLLPDLTDFRETNLSGLDVPLSVVGQELVAWSGEYARLRAEVEAKEAKIHALATVARQRADELVAKEMVIQQLLTFRYMSPGYWLFRGRRLASRYLKPILSPQLGRLTQYPPRPLRIPAWYTAQPAPNPAPLISIVTPSFNQVHFLERTMQSVLEQNYPTLEYIVQDGGSTDGTPALLDRYRDRLAYCASQKDNGQAHALNLGFAQANGDIMAYLNSDDLLLPGALTYVAAYFSQHPEVDVVYGHRVVINENDDEIGRWVLPPHDDKILGWADYIPQETLFWRRSIWKKSGGALDESYKFALDWELLLRFQAAGAKMVCLPRFLGAFRVHTAQKTSAQLADLGAAEMARLRQQCHGRPVSWAEIGRGIGPYLVRSVVYHWLYRWGLLKY